MRKWSASFYLLFLSFSDFTVHFCVSSGNNPFRWVFLLRRWVYLCLYDVRIPIFSYFLTTFSSWIFLLFNYFFHHEDSFYLTTFLCGVNHRPECLMIAWHCTRAKIVYNEIFFICNNLNKILTFLRSVSGDQSNTVSMCSLIPFPSGICYFLYYMIRSLIYWQDSLLISP